MCINNQDYSVFHINNMSLSHLEDHMILEHVRWMNDLMTGSMTYFFIMENEFKLSNQICGHKDINVTGAFSYAGMQQFSPSAVPLNSFIYIQ